jgi:hypothetical protein
LPCVSVSHIGGRYSRSLRSRRSSCVHVDKGMGGGIGQSSQRFANPGTARRNCGQRRRACFGRTSRAAAPMSGSSAPRPARRDILSGARPAREGLREQGRGEGPPVPTR